MKVFLTFLLVPVSLFSYVIVLTQLGIFQRYPVVHFIIAGIGVVILIRLMFQHFTLWRLLAVATSAALFGFFAWWTLIDSTYTSSETSVNAGEQLNDGFSNIALKTTGGADFYIGEEIAKQPMTLLVFYRGIW
jgi:hypothetical protein